MSALSLKSERRWGQEGTALELGAWRVRAGGLPGPPLSPQRKPPLYLKKKGKGIPTLFKFHTSFNFFILLQSMR